MRDTLGDRMKMYENIQNDRLLIPTLPAICRIDGRSFSRFTKGLNRPYDLRLINLMVSVTRYLVTETNACMGYTQSDEITLTWYSPDIKSEIFFKGRISKMISIIASMASVYFNNHLDNYLPVEYKTKSPHFDARVFNVPTPDEGANCFLWREWDATKNSISMAAQQFYSHKELMHISSLRKQELLYRKGVNWNAYPTAFKRGTYVQRRVVTRKFTAEEIDKLPDRHEAKKNPDLEVERADHQIIDMPVFSTVRNRTAAIYEGKEPICG